MIVSALTLMLLSAPACDVEAEETARFTAGKKGLQVTSADEQYQLSLRGYFQFDSRNFINDETGGNDQIIARRVRPILEGKAGDASFRLMPDFAGGDTQLLDAHLDYRISDALRFRLGKFKTPVGLERLQSATDMFFIERGHPNNFAPSREVGFMLHGSRDGVEYQIGIFNGNEDLGNSDNDEDDKKDLAARIFLHPLREAQAEWIRGFGIGIGSSYGKRDGSSSHPILGPYKTPGQQNFYRYRADTFADGTHWRLYPQAYWYWKNAGLTAEYALSDQEVTRGSNHDNLLHRAWQLAGSYVLTGEEVSFKGGVKPFQDVASGGIGAWELTARIGGTDLDNNSFPLFANPSQAADSATSYGAGVNWYLSENVKLLLNYDYTQFDGGAATGDRPDEHALFTRAQFRF